MRRVRWLRLVAAAIVVGLVATACGRTREDEIELRGFIGASDKVTREFTLIEAAADRWYSIEGAVQDDLRYRLSLSSPAGPLVEMIIVDDALAVRLPRPDVFADLDVPLGHPTTVDALMTGRWVVDPAAAPPLGVAGQEGALATAAERKPPTPIEVGTRLLRILRANMALSRQIKEFTLEDIEYRPSLDPWEYPDLVAGEVRYDLLRPILPVREEQVAQGNITIGENHFRKTSAFVRDGRLYQLCEVVDVEGHEEFVKLREENRENEFLEQLQKQVLDGKTVTPVRVRTMFTEFRYPRDVTIELPANALEARLELFINSLEAGLEDGLIEPPGPQPNACLRLDDAETQTASG